MFRHSAPQGATKVTDGAGSHLARSRCWIWHAAEEATCTSGLPPRYSPCTGPLAIAKLPQYAQPPIGCLAAALCSDLVYDNGLWLTVERLASQIGYVKGIDLSPGEIAEAQTRYQQVLKKYGAHRLQLLYMHSLCTLVREACASMHCRCARSQCS